jgi:hypothetical protein
MQCTHVLVVQVHIHETAQCAMVIEEVSAQCGKSSGQFLQRFTDGRAIRVHASRTTGVFAERCGQIHQDHAGEVEGAGAVVIIDLEASPYLL